MYGSGADDKSGNLRRAINDLSKAIELKPQYAGAYIMRGIAYDKAGNYQQAVNDFIKTAQLNPWDASVYIKLGLAYGNLGNFQQAINAYSKAIKVFPRYAEAYYRRGAAYLKLNNEQKGIEDIKTAAKLGSYEAKDYLGGKKGLSGKFMVDYLIEEYFKVWEKDLIKAKYLLTQNEYYLEAILLLSCYIGALASLRYPLIEDDNKSYKKTVLKYSGKKIFTKNRFDLLLPMAKIRF